MRKMPQVQGPQKQILMTTTFLGYNHNEVIQDGEMYDMQNLSGELFPLLSPRKKRGISNWDITGQEPVPLYGLHGRDQLVMIRGTDVFYNFVKVQNLTVSDANNMLPKKIVSMGAYVCIWPDKKYFNTIDQSDCGDMQRLWSKNGQYVELSMCRGDGTDYDETEITYSETTPEDPESGDLWMDQSGDRDVLRQWSEGTQMWVEVPTVYVKISATDIGKGLKEYDSIQISGLAAPEPEPDDEEERQAEETPAEETSEEPSEEPAEEEEDENEEISEKVKAQIAELNNNMIVYGCGDDYVIVIGTLSKSFMYLKDQTVRADRKVPDLDWMCESNNRLWGCRYGLENGKVVNEIRACKLGDFRNWDCYMGLSTDSYRASIGTDGVFTGAVTQRNYPVFFKENCIHRVSGNMPSSYQITTTMCRGVQRGSGLSAVVVNEAIYYKSRTDIMMYDGSMPVSVSAQLGNLLYDNARAGTVAGKYYVSMQSRTGRWVQMCFDTEKGIWYKEDELHALCYGTVDDELYCIDADHNSLVSIRGSLATGGDGTRWAEGEFDWAAVFGWFGRDYRAKKYLSRFDIRMYMEEGGEARLWIQYDDDGKWEHMGVIRMRNTKTFVLPVVPRRCDHMRFKITGRGEMRIYSISRIMEVGSDV